MPNLILTMDPEEGMHEQDLREALLRKAQLEKIRIEGSGGMIVSWDSAPIVSNSGGRMTLRWRYKQSQS